MSLKLRLPADLSEARLNPTIAGDKLCWAPFPATILITTTTQRKRALIVAAADSPLDHDLQPPNTSRLSEESTAQEILSTLLGLHITSVPPSQAAGRFTLHFMIIANVAVNPNNFGRCPVQLAVPIRVAGKESCAEDALFSLVASLCCCIQDQEK